MRYILPGKCCVMSDTNIMKMISNVNGENIKERACPPNI